MTAFDPTPLRPDAPAMPKLEFDPWGKPYMASTLTARQHAAIALCVPDSGTPWLDALIEQRLLNDFAARAMCGEIAAQNAREDVSYINIDDIKGLIRLSKYSYEVAAAMLAASKKEMP